MRLRGVVLLWVNPYMEGLKVEEVGRVINELWSCAGMRSIG